MKRLAYSGNHGRLKKTDVKKNSIAIAMKIFENMYTVWF